LARAPTGAGARGDNWKTPRPPNAGVSKDLREEGEFWLFIKLVGWVRATEDKSGNKEFAHRSVDVVSMSDSKATDTAVHVKGSWLEGRALWLIR